MTYSHFNPDFATAAPERRAEASTRPGRARRAASTSDRSTRQPVRAPSPKSLTTLATALAAVAFMVWMASFDARTQSLYVQRAGPGALASQVAAAPAPSPVSR